MPSYLTAPLISVNDDSIPSFTVRIPDPLACRPARAGRIGGRNKEHPLYCASLVDAASITKDVVPASTSVTVQSVAPGCAVTFNRRQSSFAGYSTKTGRMMSGLGPHEHAIWREFEVNPRWVDFELQGSHVTWKLETSTRGYLADFIAVDEDGHVHAGEVKASPSYYADPSYHALMDDAAGAYARCGIIFRREHGDGIRGGPRRQLNVARAFGDRFTKVTPEQRISVRRAIVDAGGTAPLGQVAPLAHPEPRTARAALNAMLCARDISFPLDARIDDETPVSLTTTPKSIPDIRALRHELTEH